MLGEHIMKQKQIEKAILSLKERLVKLYGPDVEVRIFGSVARGDYHEYSDIDILVVLPGTVNTAIEEQVFDVAYDGELDKLGIDVSQVILYGSHAKGKQRDDSDIDVAVISPTFTKLDIFERQEILSRAHHKFHVPLEPLGLTPKQLEEKQGLARVITESGITFFKQS